MTDLREPKLSAQAEREMRRWDVAQRVAEHLLRVDSPHSTSRAIKEYVVLSREAGSGAEEVALLIGQRLGFPVIDKDVLKLIAERYCVEHSLLEAVDETRGNWVREILGTWLDAHLITPDKFLVCLQRVVTAAAKREHAVFVGRGINFILPPDKGLSVRLVASERYRIARVCRDHQVSESEARRLIREWEAGRREFVARFFHHDVGDPHSYDLVVNVDRWGNEGAADLIATAFRQRFGSLETPPASTAN
ncbi:cytidylate kinase-like family protein [Thermopirellula anaerolimosa]